VRELARLVHGVAERDWSQANPSIFNGETFPDFIYSLVQRIKSGVKASVVEVKDIPACEKSENPVVTFHVDEYLLDRATDRNNNVPQNVHRTPRSQKMTSDPGRPKSRSEVSTRPVVARCRPSKPFLAVRPSPDS
jgi:hypothetical protein